MKHLSKYLAIFLFTFLLVSCDDSSEQNSLTPLTTEEIGWFSNYVPGVTQKKVYQIPSNMLREADPSYGNTEFEALYDDSGNLLGYARQVASDVACATGQCSAIRFFLIYNSEANFSVIFHPEGKSGNFYKGLDTYEEGKEEPFTAEDWNTLNSILSDPPSKLLSASDENDIVDATSTATYDEYKDYVVRYAAYTTYLTLTYMIDTKDIIFNVAQ